MIVVVKVMSRVMIVSIRERERENKKKRGDTMNNE